MSKTLEIQPLNEIGKINGYVSIFIGGSINKNELGVSFQDRVIESVQNKPYIFYNPKSDEFKQSFVNIQFKERFEWELNALKESDIILMYFDKNTKSPICLLELGLFASSGKLIVCCENDFSEKEKVDMICEMYGIKLVDTIDSLINVLNDGEIDEFLISNED
jgi:hypothetical protein